MKAVLGEYRGDMGKIECNYCHELGHMKVNCILLQQRKTMGNQPTRGGRDVRGIHGYGGGRYAGRWSDNQAHQDTIEPSDLPPIYGSSDPESAALVQLLREFLSKVDIPSDIASSDPESAALVQLLRKFLSKVDIPSDIASSNTVVNPSASVSSSVHQGNYAQSGIVHNYHHAYNSCLDSSWIIDSGASNHMTGVHNLFSTYSTCAGRERVRIADGTFSSVSGKGTINCTPSLTLSSVLHVPSFPSNLLSVSSIARDLNCRVVFLPSSCYFQELTTGKIIGEGTMHDGLYYLTNKTHHYGRNTSTSSTSAATTTIAATALCSDSDDGEDEGPFFDLDFALPVEKDERRPDQKQLFFSDADSSSDETELDLAGFPEESLRRDHILSLSPSEELFFKGRLAPLEESSLESSEKPRVAAFSVKSAAKFRVFKLGLHKKMKPGAVDYNAPNSKSESLKQPLQNKFFVKFKPEEVPIMSLFTRENSYRSSSSGTSAKAFTDVDAFSLEDKKMSPDLLLKYLSKIKPLYVRVSKRYGEKIRFSGPLSYSPTVKVRPAQGGNATIGVNDAPSTPFTATKWSSSKSQRLNSGNLPAGLRVVCQRLRKSRSASAAVTSVRSPASVPARRDDTLLAQHDGIQSAIAHCKQSLNRGPSSSPLMRSRSDPGDGRMA